MRRLLVSSVALVAVLLAGLATGAPAWAGHWSAPDAAGDVESTDYRQHPADPCAPYPTRTSSEGDLRRVSARHTTSEIVLTMRVTGLTRAWRTSGTFTVVTPRKAWQVHVHRFEGRTQVAVAPFPTFTPPEPQEGDEGECMLSTSGSRAISCPRATGRIDAARDRVRVVLPRRCLGTPRWVRVGGSVWVEQADGWSTQDSWRPRGAARDDTVPQVGRRVRAG